MSRAGCKCTLPRTERQLEIGMFPPAGGAVGVRMSSVCEQGGRNRAFETKRVRIRIWRNREGYTQENMPVDHPASETALLCLHIESLYSDLCMEHKPPVFIQDRYGNIYEPA